MSSVSYPTALETLQITGGTQFIEESRVSKAAQVLQTFTFEFISLLMVINLSDEAPSFKNELVFQLKYSKLAITQSTCYLSYFLEHCTK